MSDLPKLSRREWNYLGTLLIPLTMGGKVSLGPKTAKKFKELGLVQESEYVIEPRPGDPAWTRIRIQGWALTPYGNYVYCTWASTQPIEDNDES